MSDGPSDAREESRIAENLERAIHILQEALTDCFDPMFGLSGQAEQMVMEGVALIKQGRRRCRHDCYDLDRHRRRAKENDPKTKPLLERLSEVAITKIDHPGLTDHIQIATLYLETCPPKEVRNEIVRIWMLHNEEEARRYRLEARVDELEHELRELKGGD